jgi:hypothetical protein
VLKYSGDAAIFGIANDRTPPPGVLKRDVVEVDIRARLSFHAICAKQPEIEVSFERCRKGCGSVGL